MICCCEDGALNYSERTDGTVAIPGQGGPGLEDGRETTTTTTTTRPLPTVDTGRKTRSADNPDADRVTYHGQCASRPAPATPANRRTSNNILPANNIAPANTATIPHLLYIKFIEGTGFRFLKFDSKEDCLQYLSNVLNTASSFPPDETKTMLKAVKDRSKPLPHQATRFLVNADADNWVKLDEKEWCYTEEWRAVRCLVFEGPKVAGEFTTLFPRRLGEEEEEEEDETTTQTIITHILDNLRVWYPNHGLPVGGILLNTVHTETVDVAVAVAAAAAAAAAGEDGSFDANHNGQEDGEEDEE